MNGVYLQNPANPSFTVITDIYRHIRHQPSFPTFAVISDVSRQIRQIRHLPSSPTPEVASGNQGFYIWSVNQLNFYVMAKQAGLVKLRGTIEDLSFYRTKDGYLAREKTSVDKNRISTDPAFQRTRENGAEFGRSGVAGRIVRRAFRPLLQEVADSRLTSRLTQAMLKVVQSDSTNARGERTVTGGDLTLLQGFGFNIKADLGATVYAAYNGSVNRETGEATISIPEFIPKADVSVPSGATHLKFISGAAAINFEDGSFSMVRSDSEEIGIGNQTQEAQTLTNALTAGSALPILLVFGIEFYQEVNEVFYPLSSGSYNALSLISVDVPAAG